MLHVQTNGVLHTVSSYVSIVCIFYWPCQHVRTIGVLSIVSSYASTACIFHWPLLHVLTISVLHTVSSYVNIACIFFTGHCSMSEPSEPMVYCTVDNNGVVVPHICPQATQVAICPRMAVCGLIVAFDGSVKYDENTYVIERMKMMTGANFAWSPAQTVHSLITQARRLARIVQITYNEDKEDNEAKLIVQSFAASN